MWIPLNLLLILLTGVKRQRNSNFLSHLRSRVLAWHFILSPDLTMICLGKLSLTEEGPESYSYRPVSGHNTEPKVELRSLTPHLLINEQQQIQYRLFESPYMEGIMRYLQRKPWKPRLSKHGFKTLHYFPPNRVPWSLIWSSAELPSCVTSVYLHYITQAPYFIFSWKSVDAYYALNTVLSPSQVLSNFILTILLWGR